jgi:hypothetical protein
MPAIAWLDILQFGASCALAILVAFVIRPIAAISGRLSAIEQRLSFIEGRLSRRRRDDDLPRIGAPPD